ncbi:MAG TPA: hypothetical protein VLB44_01195 [Kofleriaceae bacterium]|nr:hypothetical protein [Kofleriaceae bacterium]
MRDGIPRLAEQADPRTETRAYHADVTRFGSTQAAPALGDAPEIGRHREDALLEAGLTVGLENRSVATLCRAYRQIRRELAMERDAHRATLRELTAEQRESARLRSLLVDDADAVVVDLDDITLRV